MTMGQVPLYMPVVIISPVVYLVLLIIDAFMDRRSRRMTRHAIGSECIASIITGGGRFAAAIVPRPANATQLYTCNPLGRFCYGGYTYEISRVHTIILWNDQTRLGGERGYFMLFYCREDVTLKEVYPCSNLIMQHIVNGLKRQIRCTGIEISV